MIYVIATLTVKSDKRADFMADAPAVIEATRHETGCLSYDLTNTITAPNEFVFVERWESREALAAHFETPHLQHWRALCDDYVAERKLEIVTPAHVEN